MSDCEPIMNTTHRKKHKQKKVKSDDDLNGMFVNMGKHIDVRELFILWIVFIFIHTEMFAEYFLKRISNATNEDCSMTMKGTFVASLIMVIAVMICAVIF